MPLLIVTFFFFLMIRRPPRSTLDRSSAASDVYKRQAIGASIGGKLANPKFPVLCITGDGSYLMNAQEISVARQLGINVVILVLNNGVLGTVMHLSLIHI